MNAKTWIYAEIGLNWAYLGPIGLAHGPIGWARPMGVGPIAHVGWAVGPNFGPIMGFADVYLGLCY
jgi:hypothetical protein